MEKGQFEILIIEDDESQSSALKEALQRQGFSVSTEKDPDKAVKNSKFKNYHLSIVDCMLPKQNGVDVAKKLYRDSHNEMATIFVSGVFKDPKFIENTVNSVDALKFFSKPFNIEELIATVTSEYERIAGEEHLTAIHSLMTRSDSSNQDKISTVNNSNTLHGLDLPHIYSLFSQSNLSGILTVKYSERRTYKVWFSDGNISRVESNDKDSFFGTLLVEYGFATLKDVKKSLANQEQKKLGEKLIDSNAISPHAIKIVYKEQMYIRLSKSIKNQFVDVHFEDKKINLDDIYINKEEIIHQQSDWLLSKM
ncbi:MAG: response regulator, partial [Bdellovibrionales bacterium]|nr:response regulator [Bdellovibrionales bacterium]